MRLKALSPRLGIHLALMAVALGLFAASPAAAQNYPNRPVRIVVPFAAGGLNDVAARLIQPYLEKALGQPVIVDNRPGAAGTIGTDAVAKAQPDGYSLLMVASSHTVIPATTPKLPYDTERDLAAVVMVGKNPMLFIVNSKVPATSLKEFVALAKGQPGKLNYSSPGAASQTHLVIELFSKQAGVTLQHIPYRGGAPAIQAAVSGEVQFTVLSPLVSMPNVTAGNLRALAVGSLARDPQLPHTPTVAEQGYPGFEAIQWVGLLATAGTPKAIIERINAEVNKALHDPDLIAKLAAQGVAPAGGTPDDFQNTIAAEIRNWTEVARAANIKAE